jgi:translation initiation factor IF-3
LSRPNPRFSSASFVRVNGKIRAREVRVIDTDGKQLGVLTLHDAIRAAQSKGVDLVEVAPTATPPVCRLVDYGKFRYEKSKEEKESRKHQHANKVKEVQLSPSIDPHDFGIKLSHAVEFLCDEIKVKVTLKFRGREMAHKEIGFMVVEKFIKNVAAYGHPDAPPKQLGKGINVMISPLPRSKRGKSPQPHENAEPAALGERTKPAPALAAKSPAATEPVTIASKQPPSPFANNPFAKLDLTAQPDGAADAAAESS